MKSLSSGFEGSGRKLIKIAGEATYKQSCSGGRTASTRSSLFLVTMIFGMMYRCTTVVKQYYYDIRAMILYYNI